MSRLRLLDEVAWEGTPLPGGRAGELLAALALAGGRVVADADLVEQVWEADVPANPTKALQVLVSRVRAQTAPDAVVRAGQGYRLGAPADDVDALAQRALVARAREAEQRGDGAGARDLAREALALGPASAGTTGPAVPTSLARLRADARDARDEARAVLGRVLSAMGDHAEALDLLGAVERPDEATLAALLRSEASVRGAPEALARLERHRGQVRASLGVDPGPVLQTVQAELLAADDPVRDGVRQATSSLVGREDDLRALRALVRESRVVSILGPGGLGKTTLAHLLGREAEQPVVRFVELVGVAAADDVVGEVGSALGVRDSVSGLHVLSADQRNDVRGRIAQQLGQAPTLLILDNCEHVVESVADLVAFLVATVRRLCVVTTTRAPLAISAERVFALGHLGEDDAARLFTERARAARPGVALDPDVVRRVVARLDGLPLAIELAAARVRAMSVEDVDRRLDDRFALLRGGDRSAPDRHRTLLAVIDWSWNLLDEQDRRGLRRLAVFADGFTLDAAEEVVGAGALDVVESLVAQSLLAVGEAGGSVRYRMLETVREFGRRQLREAGEEADARAALESWARAYARRAQSRLYSADQVAAVDALTTEESNLADVLRDALGVPDPPLVVALVAALGGTWTIRGEHQRMVAMTWAVEQALDGWVPPDDLVDETVLAATAVTLNQSIAIGREPRECRRLIAIYGARCREPRTRAMARVMDAFDPTDPLGSHVRLAALYDDPDRHVAAQALQWSSHGRENAGDPRGGAEVAARSLALWRPEDGPWTRALLLAQLAGLYAQLGDEERALAHAREALPLLESFGAYDDSVQVRSVIAGSHLLAGRLDEAEAVVARMVEDERAHPGLGGAIAVGPAVAELALARGDVVGGLQLYRDVVDRLRAMSMPGLQIPSGLEPWTVFGECTATMAHARHTDRGGEDLLRVVRSKAAGLLDPAHHHLDVPMAGLTLFALGGWIVHRGGGPLEVAVDLLALADGFGYSRYTPSLAWAPTAAVADARAPGLLATRLASYAGLRAPDLLDPARAALAALARLTP